MKIKKILFVFAAYFSILQLTAQGIVTNYYSVANGKYYVLPINATNDSSVARTMFENFANAAGIVFEPQSFTCNSAYIPAPFIIINKPNALSKNLLKKAEIKIFSEKNYDGEVATIKVGASLTCMDSQNPDFEAKDYPIVKKVGNDEISSVQIPRGLKLTVWEHCPFEGNSKVFTSDTKDLEDWDDIISSLKVELIDSIFSQDASYAEVTKENYSTQYPFFLSLGNFPVETKKVSFTMSSIEALQNNKTTNNSWILQSMFGTNTYCIYNQNTGEYLQALTSKSYIVTVNTAKAKGGMGSLDKSFLWFLHYDPLTKTHQLTNMLTGNINSLSFNAMKNSFYLGQNILDIKNARWILTPNLK